MLAQAPPTTELDMQILDKWTPQEKRAYGSEIQTFSHKLADSGLFTDGALADLLNRHP